MPTADRRYYMRGYMKEYRRHSVRHGELKTAHRLDTVKWRLSELLSSQYEILFFVQYKPVMWASKDTVPNWTKVGKNRLMEYLPVLQWFKYVCDPGGCDLFKVFLFMRLNRKHDQITYCIVGVLDREALLKNLQQLTGKLRNEFTGIIKMLEMEEREERWHRLNFPNEGVVLLRKYLYCCSLKWTVRKQPNWKSVSLRNLLHRWEMGSRRVGKWEKWERGINDDPETRGMSSCPPQLLDHCTVSG